MNGNKSLPFILVNNQTNSQFGKQNHTRESILSNKGPNAGFTSTTIGSPLVILLNNVPKNSNEQVNPNQTVKDWFKEGI